ncbi:MarR family winged helix-turn-helix transcriptional regulator [Streptomyces sp. TP-A0874]|uniref:MarR family winged helix-turn-helix transcriptional regulator n=1 Tax=Streptomyces sp. TP-A0874 TaxID=549819 RepID=UPI0014799ADA|nr:MarR family transcriptional regulator [Streptomyces sp. TP-A0874]
METDPGLVPEGETPVPRYARSLQTMLLRTQQAVAPEFRAIFGQFGLTQPQWRVIRVLWEKEGQSISALAEAALLDQPVVVGVVDRLQRSGLVQRQRSETDRRLVHVLLTEKGRALKDDALPAVRDAYERLGTVLTEKEWEMLFSLLDKVVDGVHQGDQDAR